MTDAAALARLPKVELHCHWEGCIRPATFLDLARRHGVPVPSPDPAEAYAYSDMTSFLAVFERIGAVVRTRDDVARITLEALEDAAAAGVVYRETFVNPTTHPACPYPQLLAGLRDGIAEAERRSGIVARVIPSIYRNHSPAQALELVRQVLAHACEEVVGIGIDGDETLGPPTTFAEAFALAASAGLHRTAHAGERFATQEIWDCLEVLGCERIDHGYGIVDDEALQRRCRDEQVHVTYAWLSTRYNYSGPLERHPFPRMHAAGLRMSLGSDDPAIAGTDLGGDYVTVADAFGWGLEVFAEQVRWALDAAWCDAGVKARVARRLEAATA